MSCANNTDNHRAWITLHDMDKK